MAKTSKRITGDYDIITNDGTSGNVLIDTDTVTVNGNLNVVGTQTTVSSTDPSLADNTIILNNGESTNGVSRGTAGIEVDRGVDGSTANDHAKFQFNETGDIWEARLGAAYAILRAGEPPASPDNNDVVTVSYLASLGIGGGGVDKITEGDSKVEIFDTGSTQKFTVEIDATEVLSVDATTLQIQSVDKT